MRHPYLDIMFIDLFLMGTQVSWQFLLFLIMYPDRPHCPQRHLKTHSSIRISSESALNKSIYLHLVYYSFVWFTMVHHSLCEFYGIWHIFVNIPCNSLSTKPTHVLDSVPKLWKVPSCSDLLFGLFVPQNKGQEQSAREKS